MNNDIDYEFSDPITVCDSLDESVGKLSGFHDYSNYASKLTAQRDEYRQHMERYQDESRRLKSDLRSKDKLIDEVCEWMSNWKKSKTIPEEMAEDIIIFFDNIGK